MLNYILIAITVLTWNTGRLDYKHKPPQNEALTYLMAQDADIICLQEVDVYKDTHYLTLQDVKQTLGKKYPYSYLDFSVYNRRHQFGSMVWSKYPLINKQTIHYETKGNLSNRCDVVVGSDTIRLINNHLESYNFVFEDIADADTLRTYEGFLSSFKRLKAKWERAVPLRNEQARVVRKEIDASPYPVMVVGDFNAVEWSYAYLHIKEGLRDTWRELHPLSWGTTCEHRGVGVRIDYILCSESIVPKSCEVKNCSVSDHRPVVAILCW